jgi:selenide, water dikinase
MISPMLSLAGRGERVLVGAETSDDAGVFAYGARALVATADFITPVCDDARRYGRVAAANSLSDVFAMGGQPLFVLNLCCFPTGDVPDGVLGDVLAGAAEATLECGAVLLGGHTVGDKEMKFGLAVVGEVDPERVWANTNARVGDRLVLTKPLGTGVLINAHKVDKLDDEGLEVALKAMEQLNAKACELGQKHGVRAATDITGFGFAGHALNIAKGSGVAMRVEFEALPVHDGFYRLVKSGVTTGSTAPNERNAAPYLVDRVGLDKPKRDVLFDAQTSGGLLLSTPAENADELLRDLLASGHQAAIVGEVLAGPPQLEIV